MLSNEEGALRSGSACFLRLRGGGGDGGVYPLTHAQQKWMTPSGMGTTGGGCHSNAQKDRASEGTLRLDRASVCAATSKALRAPIAICDMGFLLNKEDVIELMLSKALPPHLSHIKSLKSLHDATLHPNPAFGKVALGHTSGMSEGDDEPPFACPVAMIPLNGRYPFVLIRPTGHVVSQRALTQVGGKLCPVTETPLASADAILSINPSEDERQQLREKLQARKAEGKKSKAKAAAAGEAGGSATATATATATPSHGGAASGSSSSAAAAAGAAAAAAKGGSSQAKATAKGSTGGPMPLPSGSAAAKRPRSEWEAAARGSEAFAQKAASSAAYKSLFISAEDRKKQAEADAKDFCARSIVPTVNNCGFGLG